MLRSGAISQEILESMDTGVLAFDKAGAMVFANSAACQILHLSPEDAFASSSLETEGVVARCQEMIRHVLRTSEPIIHTWRESRICLNLSVKPWKGCSGALLFIQDKSDQDSLLERDKQFIANASHELRTPITIIQGFAETLCAYPKLSPRTVGDISEKIARTSKRLENLVQSLLALSNLEYFSEEKLREADLFEIASHCRDLVLGAYPNAQIAMVRTAPRLVVRADPQLLDLAIVNLLENGIKYSLPPAKLRIAMHVRAPHVLIEVHDEGIGIPPEALPSIFNRFYKVDRTQPFKSKGVGLGLSLVKEIVEKHHGFITVSSEVGMGSIFTIFLPLPSP